MSLICSLPHVQLQVWLNSYTSCQCQESMSTCNAAREHILVFNLTVTGMFAIMLREAGEALESLEDKEKEEK